MLKTCLIIVEIVVKLLDITFFKQILLDVNIFWIVCRDNYTESISWFFYLKSLTDTNCLTNTNWSRFFVLNKTRFHCRPISHLKLIMSCKL